MNFFTMYAKPQQIAKHSTRNPLNQPNKPFLLTFSLKCFTDGVSSSFLSSFQRSAPTLTPSFDDASPVDPGVTLGTAGIPSCLPLEFRFDTFHQSPFGIVPLDSTGFGVRQGWLGWAGLVE
jgi:hypothetical protein